MKTFSYIFIVFIATCSCQQYKRVQTQVAPAEISEEVAVLKQPWSFFGEDGEKIQTQSWTIYTTLKYEHIVSQLPQFYDSLIELYATEFGNLPFPNERLDVYLFATEKQWQLQVQKMLGRNAAQWYELGRGGLTIDGVAVLYDLDNRGRSRTTLRIAAHEGWHQYAEAIFVDELPTWLDEGIGTWMEGFRLRRGELQFEPTSNWDRLTALRKIVKANRLTPLSELITSDPEDLLATGRSTLLGYYAQLWGFISYLMESENGIHRPAMQRIFHDALTGNLHRPTSKSGWLQRFTNSPIQFEENYLQWVKEYVQPGNSWR